MCLFSKHPQNHGPAIHYKQAVHVSQLEVNHLMLVHAIQFKLESAVQKLHLVLKDHIDHHCEGDGVALLRLLTALVQDDVVVGVRIVEEDVEVFKVLGDGSPLASAVPH